MTVWVGADHCEHERYCGERAERECEPAGPPSRTACRRAALQGSVGESSRGVGRPAAVQLLGNGPHRVVEARRVASWRIERILGLRLVEGRARITRLAGLVSQRDNRREILIALERWIVVFWRSHRASLPLTTTRLLF